MAKKKTGFSKPPEKNVDSSESLAFIDSAGSEAKPSGKKAAAGKRPPKEQTLADVIKQFKGLMKPLQEEQGLHTLLKNIRELEELERWCFKQHWQGRRQAGRLLSNQDPGRAGLSAKSTAEILRKFNVTNDEIKTMIQIARLDNDGFDKAIADLKSGGPPPWIVPAPDSSARNKRPDQDQAPAAGGPREDIMDENFKQAVDQMIEAIKKADEQGWTTTSKATALDYVEMFRHMIMIDGED